MTASGERWVEVTPSQFAHEQDGLERIRAIIPDETPFRAWSNVEFRDSRGRWHEVDLLLLGRGALHLIELKYYSGTLRGDDQRWARDGRRPEDSPLKLARRKAQYLASRLTDELRVWAAEKRTTIPDPRDVIPFVQESVFLHHPDMRCLLSPSSALGLYGLDGNEARSGLPGISELVRQPAGRRAVGRNQELILVELLARIGLVQRREREAGSWVIEDQAIDSGTGWQDWLASHKVVATDRARIRFHVLAPSAGQQERAAARQVAEHEFRLMSRLQHDGLLRPRDLVESELGIGTVYPYDPQWQRLDLWLADQRQGVPLPTQLSMIRQIGEALQYAHNNKVVHRGLSPLAVWVWQVPGTADVKVRVGDWQTAGSAQRASATQGATRGVTTLFGLPGGEESQGLAEVFTPPENLWSPDADRVRLDVYAWGSLAFYLLTGAAPAASSAALKQRLREQQGLDLAIELPQVSSTVRSLVLKATRPSPSQRTPDVTTALAQLSAAEREAATGDDRVDPLDAVPGTVLDGRFRLDKRLGQGSTAVGLQVEDLLAEGADTTRVLKVALDEAAAARLDDEAAVLSRLKGPRFVRLVEGPLVVGGRRALLLESAGESTLADVLRHRTRLSLDLLERYGTDVLDMLVALDKAGVDHRDIKPANLGVREGRGDRQKHLVLFDFSLSGAAAAATSAGTPPYLDPFLGGTRNRYDSAAERYAAAVVLFEMATGATPVHGDGDADPATVPDAPTVELEAFDPALAAGLVPFFRTALARDARERHHTAEQMRAEWLALFSGGATTQPDDSDDELAGRATLTTPLRDSGLTARALSALEPYDVHTVGELLTIDPVRLSRLRGVANATRGQITARMKEWKARLGTAGVARRPGRALTPSDAADLLHRVAATPRTPSRGAMVRLVLGFAGDVEAFATQAVLAARLDPPVTPARAGQLLDALQGVWAADAEACELLESLSGRVSAGLSELGEVATVAELTRVVAESLAEEPHPDERLLRGLLRLALDRRRATFRADDAKPTPVWVRRRGGVVTLLASDPALFDVAESLGAEADRIVAAAGDAERVLVPAARVRTRLDLAVPPAQGQGALAEPSRRVALAAAASTRAAASGNGDLHHRDLSATAAVASTFAGFGGLELTAVELRDRVRVRFPALADLPTRPVLDAVVRDAGLPLVFDDRRGAYRAVEAGGATTGLEPRRPTTLALTTSPVGVTGALGARLEASLASRSFVALGVYADRMRRFADVAEHRYGATVLDLTQVLLESLRASSAAAKVPWQEVRRADTAGASTTAGRGLSALVQRAWPDVEAAVERALADGDGRAPLLLTEAAPLARYDNVALLSRWTDLAAARARAVWLLVPQLGGNYGPLVDGRPVPLAAPNQFVVLDNEWIDSMAAAPSGVAGVQRES
ncbi:MAG: BREX system serine/threonine kinase PglW [Kineosporiaceae bacterium]